LDASKASQIPAVQIAGTVLPLWLQSLLDDLQQGLLDGAPLGRGNPVERAFNEEHGEAVDGGPGEIFGALA
jgi:hypothetical protein